MKAKTVELKADSYGSAFWIDQCVNLRTIITLTEGFKERATCFVSPANLRAIAAACVEAADELEGK